MPEQIRMPKMHFRLCVLLIAIALYLATPAVAETLSGQVIGVTDGDTITVLASNTQHKIRLSGIDCPEKSQAYGARAKREASDAVFSKNVTVNWEKKDRYGRILGKVLLPSGESLNQLLVRNGWCWHYKKYSKDKALALLETQASKAGKGLWQTPNPVPPWDFRRKKSTSFKNQAPRTSGEIIANRRSKIYHLPNCLSYNKVSPKNRVYYKTKAEAEGAGYRIARNCR